MKYFLSALTDFIFFDISSSSKIQNIVIQSEILFIRKIYWQIFNGRVYLKFIGHFKDKHESERYFISTS